MTTSAPSKIFSAACLAVALGTGPTLAKDQSIEEFNAKNADKLAWRVVNDGVMGGLSQGKIVISDKGILNFSGTLSLENNGGFSSIRTGDVDLDLSNFTGLVARVKGDGRTYQMRLNSDARYRGMSVSFGAEFPTEKGQWKEVKVPFSKLSGSWRGMSLKDKVFNPKKIERLGLILADKKPGSFDLKVDWIRAYKADSEASTIVDLALADGRFGTLATALTKADLVDAVAGEGPLTVFAPTDEAFAKLPEGTVASLLKPENREKLQAILKYHVVSGSVGLSDALKAGEAETLQGTQLTVGFSEGRVKVDDAIILNADLSASNGVIHVIDSVLLPPAPTNDLIGVAKAAGSFKTLLAATEAAGLTSILQGEGPFTILAPTDEAFAKLPKGTVASLLKTENLDQLRNILTYHAFAGKISAGDALNAGSAKTINGQEVCFGIQDGQFKVNDAIIRSTDIKADNGVIHVIDSVLLPNSKGHCEAKRDGEKDCPDTLSPTTLIDAAIKRGVPIFNKGDHEGCARIYQETLTSIAKDKQVDANTRKAVKNLLESTNKHSDATRKAWIYRKSLDHLYMTL